MKKIIATLLGMYLCLPLVSIAEQYSEVSNVKSITVNHGNWVRVRLASMGPYESCGATTPPAWYVIDLSATDLPGKEMYSALLTAKATGQKVYFQLNGCFRDTSYTSITAVYYCDTRDC
jgi:hypothetical protein